MLLVGHYKAGDNPMISISPTLTLTDLVRLYALHHPGLEPKSLACYGYAVRSLERFWGHILRAGDLGEDLILPWLAQRLRDVAPKTAKRERGDLLTLWRFAYKQNLLSREPRNLPTVKVPKKNPNSWTIEEYRRLVAACKNLHGEIRGTGIDKVLWWESMLTFLYWIGCRISAALAVKSTDVDLARGLVKLRAETSKTDWEQILTLHPQAIEAIRLVWSIDRQYVWPWPYNRNHVWTPYKKILDAAGLPKDRTSMFQKTRRTTYTLCVKFGNKDIASHQLGHRTDMSRYYLDMSQIEYAQAANVLPVF